MITDPIISPPQIPTPLLTFHPQVIKSILFGNSTIEPPFTHSHPPISNFLFASFPTKEKSTIRCASCG